jgi:hypothetical protein
MSPATCVAGILLIAASTVSARSVSRQPATAPSRMEGPFEYVGALKGQSIMVGGRFVFLYGPSDGSAPMTGEAGTYKISRDTATHTVTYSSDPQRVGTVFLWTPTSWSRDTVSYVVMNAQRQVTAQGRSVKR